MSSQFADIVIEGRRHRVPFFHDGYGEKIVFTVSAYEQQWICKLTFPQDYIFVYKGIFNYLEDALFFAADLADDIYQRALIVTADGLPFHPSQHTVLYRQCFNMIKNDE
ncbi:hypothetical protein [Klebsiella variicola]|uniref:hypothetical protein n=1 Tax=Klebsiella variicola TaxID=244366 RepID=UPI00115A53EC|nr:hypothetical protein [Klebsiella variicola]